MFLCSFFLRFELGCVVVFFVGGVFHLFVVLFELFFVLCVCVGLSCFKNES